MGPPGTGKTSLRKVFFEGESTKKILDFSLEPTCGEESLVLKFEEMIGVFDLAGQENDTWLQVNQDSILKNTKIIILVVDCTNPIDNNLDFIKRVVEVRDLIVPECLIYILVHKIDLINDTQLNDVKLLLNDRLYYYNHINISYTSIQKEYFSHTFAVFIDILRKCIQKDIASERTDISFVHNSISSLYLINQSKLISREELQYQLHVPELEFTKTEDYLIKNELVKIKDIGASSLYQLTEKGTSNIDKLFQNFSLENIGLLDSSTTPSISKPKSDSRRFLGFFMASKTGIPLLKAEIEEDYFENFLKSENPENRIDADLISTLVSALEMFSNELNIKDLSGFKLKGSNIMIQSFNYEKVTIGLIVRSGTNIKALRSKLENWFQAFLNTNDETFNQAIRTGNISNLYRLAEEGSEWLRELNNSYDSFITNHEIFDINEPQSLYELLNKIPVDSITNEEFTFVKKLKSELLRSSIVEDIVSLKDLSKKIKNL